MFAALADGTRRAVLHDLDGGPRSITELAAPHGMSLTGFIKHVRVLEDAGLLVREKEGRTVRCTLTPDPMRNAAAWLAHYEKFWNERLDALARYLYHEEEVRPWPAESKKNPRSASPAPSARRKKKSGGRGPKPKP